MMYCFCYDQCNKEVRKQDSNHLPALATESQLAMGTDTIANKIHKI